MASTGRFEIAEHIEEPDVEAERSLPTVRQQCDADESLLANGILQSHKRIASKNSKTTKVEALDDEHLRGRQSATLPPTDEHYLSMPSQTPSLRSPDVTGLTATGRHRKAKEGERIHGCVFCGRVYTRGEHLRRHHKKHKAEAFPCRTPNCDCTFSSAELRHKHENLIWPFDFPALDPANLFRCPSRPCHVPSNQRVRDDYESETDIYAVSPKDVYLSMPNHTSDPSSLLQDHPQYRMLQRHTSDPNSAHWHNEPYSSLSRSIFDYQAWQGPATSAYSGLDHALLSPQYSTPHMLSSTLGDQNLGPHFNTSMPTVAQLSTVTQPEQYDYDYPDFYRYMYAAPESEYGIHHELSTTQSASRYQFPPPPSYDMGSALSDTTSTSAFSRVIPLDVPSKSSSKIWHRRGSLSDGWRSPVRSFSNHLSPQILTSSFTGSQESGHPLPGTPPDLLLPSRSASLRPKNFVSGAGERDNPSGTLARKDEVSDLCPKDDGNDRLHWQALPREHVALKVEPPARSAAPSSFKSLSLSSRDPSDNESEIDINGMDSMILDQQASSFRTWLFRTLHSGTDRECDRFIERWKQMSDTIGSDLLDCDTTQQDSKKRSRSQAWLHVASTSRPSKASSSDRGQCSDNEENDDEGRRREKRTRWNSQSRGPGLSKRLACLYNRYDPSVYRSNAQTQDKFEICGSHDFENMHRLHEHLLRVHCDPPLQCPRCTRTDFTGTRDLQAHQMAAEPCSLVSATASKRILWLTRQKCRELKTSISHKFRGSKSEEEKWRFAYQQLFPDADPANIPSPYLEDVVVSAVSSMTDALQSRLRAAMQQSANLAGVVGMISDIRRQILRQYGIEEDMSDCDTPASSRSSPRPRTMASTTPSTISSATTPPSLSGSEIAENHSSATTEITSHQRGQPSSVNRRDPTLHVPVDDCLTSVHHGVFQDSLSNTYEHHIGDLANFEMENTNWDWSLAPTQHAGADVGDMDFLVDDNRSGGSAS